MNPVKKSLPRTIPTKLALIVAAAFLSLGRDARAASPQFDLVTLQAPPTTTNFTVSLYDGVSAGGWAVGYSNSSDLTQVHAYRWDALGEVTLLADPVGAPGGDPVFNTRAVGVDAQGNAVGQSSIDGQSRTIRWDTAGNPTILPQGQGAGGINEAGQILIDNARLNPDGSTTTFDSLNGTAFVTSLTSIGSAVGNGSSRGVAWSADGTATILSTAIGASSFLNSSTTVSRNAIGDVVGDGALRSGNPRPVIWTNVTTINSGTATFLNAPGGGALLAGSAEHIDDLGRIIGHGVTTASSPDRAIFWNPDHSSVYLDQALTISNGWSLSGVVGIDSTALESRIVAVGKNPAVNNGDITYVMLHEHVTPNVSSGTGVRAAADGGAQNVGGVTATFGSVTGNGALSVDYDPTATAGDLSANGYPALPGGFALAGGASEQLWTVSLDGATMSGPITLSLGFDPSLLNGVDPSTLLILHLTHDSVWEQLTPSFVGDNYLTITTSSFSPFLLTTVPTPEPGSLGALALLGLLARRKRR